MSRRGHRRSHVRDFERLRSLCNASRGCVTFRAWFCLGRVNDGH